MAKRKLYQLTATQVMRLGRMLRAFESGSLAQSSSGGLSITETQHEQIPFRNDSGEEIPPYAVMRITGADVDDPDDEQQVDNWFLKVEKPNTTFYREYLVNGPETVPYSGGGAEDFGVGYFLRDARYVSYREASGTPAYGEVWGPKADQWTLEKYRYGFTIQGHATTIDDVNVVLATQHLVTKVRGTTDGAINKDSTGTVNLLDSNQVDTGDNITSVRNPFANVATGKDVHVGWIGDKPELEAAECGT